VTLFLTLNLYCKPLHGHHLTTWQSKIVLANPLIINRLLYWCFFLYFRYTPQQQSVSFNSGAKQRTIHMFEVQKDPMEPPRFRWVVSILGVVIMFFKNYFCSSDVIFQGFCTSWTVLDFFPGFSRPRKVSENKLGLGKFLKFKLNFPESGKSCKKMKILDSWLIFRDFKTACSIISKIFNAPYLPFFIYEELCIGL